MDASDADGDFSGLVLGGFSLVVAWTIIQLSKLLVTPIHKPFRPLTRGTTLLRGLINHGYKPLTNWDDPPSVVCFMEL